MENTVTALSARVEDMKIQYFKFGLPFGVCIRFTGKSGQTIKHAVRGNSLDEAAYCILQWLEEND